MNIWDQLVDCICRPPRDVYSPAELLGGSRETFMIGAMECTRLDYELTNQQGMKLQCSHYFPLDARSADGKLPVVVYCHCNSGSRRDAEEAVYHLLPCGVGVVAFDFTGSGLSDGKWVTLGAHEVEDLGVVVRHLRSQGGISSIGLWGRSMGAVTALMYSHSDPDIAGMVLDSPFSRLTDLMLEIVVSQRLPIPKMMLKLALRLMRNSVRRKAGCDINTVSPLDVVPRAAIPAMFGHGEEDSFINIQHSVKLYEAYNSAAEAPAYKNMVRFRGDHNHPRPSFFYSSVCCFFHQQLKLDQVLLGGNPADTQQLMQYGSLTLSSAHDHLDRANGFINTPWTLEPVSALSPADEAAAAALLAAEGGYSNSGATPGSDGCAATAAAGSSGTSGGCADRISSPLRVATKSSKGGAKSQAGAGVVHISEGGLNSPRASPRRDGGRTMVAVDAGASSSGSSGGGMSRQAGAAAGGGSSRHGSNGRLEWQHQQRRQQQRLSASPPGLSHMHQQQQHDSQHPRHHSHWHQQQQQHNQQHRPQQQQQQRSFTSLEDMPDGQQPLLLQQQQLGYQQPDPSWQLASAVPVPPAAPGGRMQGSAAGALPVCPSDPLFTVGSRGAQDAVLGGAHAADAAGAGTGLGLHSLRKSAPGAPALSAAAGTEAILQQQAAAAASACPNSTGRGVSAAGSSSGGGAAAASAGAQHFKWLFKRTGSSGSSGGGSTPSTSPPASAGVDAAVAAVERHRSHGSSLSNGSRADAGCLSAVLAPGAAAGVATAVQQQGQQQHRQQGQEGASQQQQQQQQQKSHRSRGGGGSSGGGLPAAAGAGAAINGRAAVAPSSDVVSGACRSDLLTGAAGPEEEWVDPDIAAAIAASLADQQVLGQQQQQGPPPVLQTRQPHSLEEEEEMLREAIALSLALPDTPAQQQEQQQDGLQAQPPAVVPQQHEHEQQPSVLPSNP